VVTIHSDPSGTIPGSRHYIHADDVSNAILFLLGYKGAFEPTLGGAKCPKFNIVGSEEIDNLELARLIADIQGRALKYDMVDFHSSRPGHDLRYALCDEKMRQMGWEPRKSVRERIAEVTKWTLDNQQWIEL
jgi:dTDP-glucose 4,6-dehydratase